MKKERIEMRKKDILGNFVKNPNVFYTHSIKKLNSKHEAYTALITYLPGTREKYAVIDGKQVLLTGSGYKWLTYLPMNEHWSLLTAFCSQNEIVEWYFDISRGNYLDESGMPCIDDIYLDLVIKPSGETSTLDADELQEALDKNMITSEDYNHAYMIHDQIKNSQWSDVKFLTELSEKLLADYCPR